MKARRLETVVQFVGDPQKSQAWYADLLGIEPTPYEGPYFKFNEHSYLIRAPSAPGTGRGGTGVWFEVASVDEAYRELMERGYALNEPPFDIPPGRLVTLNDPTETSSGSSTTAKVGCLDRRRRSVASVDRPADS